MRTGDEGEPPPEELGDDVVEEPGGDERESGEEDQARFLQETVEADVLALGDAEEAAEAAARAEGTFEPEPEQEPMAVPEAPAAAVPDAVEQPEEREAPQEIEEPEEIEQPQEIEEPAAVGEPHETEAPGGGAVATEERPPVPPPAPTPGFGPPGAPSEGDDRPPRSGLWLRFLTASVVIVVSMGTATAMTGLLYLTEIAEGLGGITGVRKQLTQVEGGEPQNILILGSDERPEDPTARSDTTMLLRLDPSQDAIALFSLPRDLKVNIPGYGVDRLNAAYTVGGPKLTLRTVQQVTGLDIHHVVNVDFGGFYRAVNAIDCVYVDVDRRYYVPPEASYAEIDIEAGYQLLCGERALQYVRFRHADTDITRTARQQDFLREARQKIGPARLFRDRDQLIKIFTRYTTSDIEDARIMLEVFKLFLSVSDAPVREIHFEGNIGPSYITFSQEQMRQAVDQFLGIQDTAGSLGGGVEEAADGGGGGGGGKREDKPEPNLIDSSQYGADLAGDFARQVRFPVYYPTKLTPGSQFSADSRTYEIEDTDGDIHKIYKFVIQTPLIGEYYGISGTTWTDPPILDNPSETREVGEREYDLFYDGDRLRLVAWHTDRGSYWLNNSLLQSIDEEQMLEIAEMMRAVSPGK